MNLTITGTVIEVFQGVHGSEVEQTIFLGGEIPFKDEAALEDYIKDLKGFYKIHLNRTVGVVVQINFPYS